MRELRLVWVMAVAACHGVGPANTDTDVASDSSAGGDTDVVSDTDIASDTDVTSDTDFTADTDVVADTDVADTDVPRDTAWDSGILPAVGKFDTSSPEVDTSSHTGDTTDTGTYAPSPCMPGAGADATYAWGTSCYLVYFSGLPHADAEMACVGIGGHLASIASADESRAVGRLGLTSLNVWLGGTDAAVEGSWAWTDGSRWRYASWYDGEPNNSNGAEDCVERYSDGSWNDGDCGAHVPFVCEVDTCGNASLDAGEACDDGNHTNGDACDDNCTLPVCGNGVVDPNEGCDDGNHVNGDGCEGDCSLVCGASYGAVAAWAHGSSCRFELGTFGTWDGARAACADVGASLPSVADAADNTGLQAIVPGGFVGLRDTTGNGDFAWDDGSLFAYRSWDRGRPGPGPDPLCTSFVNGTTAWDQIACDGNMHAVLCQADTPTCGDGVADPGEACDDGNTVTERTCPYGDASCVVCDARCAEVSGVVSSQCGDGVVDAANGETCDDAVFPSGLCNSCQAVPSATCVGAPNQCWRDVWTTGPGLGVDVTDDGYDGSIGSMTCVDVDVQPAVDRLVGRIAVSIAMSHTYVGDLTMKLVSPTGAIVTLTSQPGWYEWRDNGTYNGPGESSGHEAADLDVAYPITFGDGFSPRSESMGAGLTDEQAVCRDDGVCAFSPSSGAADDALLRSLAQEPKRGTWSLCVGDSGAEDLGVIDSVSVMFRP